MPITPLAINIKLDKGLFNEGVKGSNTIKEVIETDYLEFYLSFFYYSLPLESPPEDYSVIIEGLNEEKPLVMKYNVSKGQNLYEEQIRTLFRKLQVGNVLKLIKCCLLEKSIIVFAEEPNDSIAVTESLLQLINPL